MSAVRDWCAYAEEEFRGKINRVFVLHPRERPWSPSATRQRPRRAPPLELDTRHGMGERRAHKCPTGEGLGLGGEG